MLTKLNLNKKIFFKFPQEDLITDNVQTLLQACMVAIQTCQQQEYTHLFYVLN